MYNQNCPCDLTKKMNTHTLCFCPRIESYRRLKFWNGLKAVNGESRGYPISPVKYNLYFHCIEIQLFIVSPLWNTAYFLKKCIIFNQYFPVFHYFVVNNETNNLFGCILLTNSLFFTKLIATENNSGSVGLCLTRGLYTLDGMPEWKHIFLKPKLTLHFSRPNISLLVLILTK